MRTYIAVTSSSQQYVSGLMTCFEMERSDGDALDIVCGHYYKRKTSPMESAILELDEGWPLLPMFDPPREGLHEIGSGGWGIAFMSRKVIDDVAANMPNGDPLFSAGQVPWASPGETLGPDVRFYLIARKLGYKVWLDASVHSAHATPISRMCPFSCTRSTADSKRSGTGSCWRRSTPLSSTQSSCPSWGV